MTLTTFSSCIDLVSLSIDQLEEMVAYCLLTLEINKELVPSNFH